MNINTGNTSKNEVREVSRPVFRPYADIIDNGNSYLLKVEMPGVSENTLEIEFKDNILSINGKTSDIDVQGRKLIYQEWSYGDYSRSFEIGNEVNQEKIEARISDGVVSLILPKNEKQKPRKIEVKKSED